MYLAILDCGTHLHYEAPNLVPAPGEWVPCRRHGYCVVHIGGRSDGAPGTGCNRPRAHLRSQVELMECLERRPVTTVHALRRQRFTLRLVAAAQRDGLVDLDFQTGEVRMLQRSHGDG